RSICPFSRRNASSVPSAAHPLSQMPREIPRHCLITSWADVTVTLHHLFGIVHLGRGRRHEKLYEGRHHSGYRRSLMGAPSGLCSGSSEVVTSTIGGSTGFWSATSGRRPVLFSFAPDRHHHRQQTPGNGDDGLLLATSLLQLLVHVSPARRLPHQAPGCFHHGPAQ